MKKILPYLLIPFIITACGGSDNGSSTNTENDSSDTENNSDSATEKVESTWKYQKITIDPVGTGSDTLELSFDNQGNLISAIGIGDNPTKDVYAYNEKNQVISIMEDYTNDGTVDAITTYGYDANGNLTTRSVDTDFDGGVDGTVTNTYNNSNQHKTMSLSAVNEGLLVKEVYAYNMQGKPLTTTIDDSVNGAQNTNADGTVDNTTTYTYNDDGTLKEKIRDQYNDKFSFTYNEQKQLTLETVDFNNNGTVDEARSYSYQYDMEGRITEKQKADEFNTFSYEEYGNLARLNIQRGENDPIDVTFVYKAFDFLGEELALTINVSEHLKNEPYIDSPFFNSYLTYRLRSPVYVD